MKKQALDIVKGYVRKLPDHELEELRNRLVNRYGGDLAECCRLFQRNSEMDSLLRSTSGGDDWLDVVDLIQNQVLSESEKRYVSR